MGFEVFQRTRGTRRGGPAFRVETKTRRLVLNRAAFTLLAGATHVLIVVDRKTKQFGLVGTGDSDPKGVKITGISGKTFVPVVAVGDFFDKAGIPAGSYPANLVEVRPSTTGLIATHGQETP